ncbi:MAG: HlyC/CorC family transporter [Muribaculaceae bacterium]|nr:HlyC/CorC family transporter [Muribaculaceae bacterium]MBQ2562102.1 HlyC/CorC family transporter [Muribaculaceae bacterium]MBQ5408648.1 HlyC/CorC family transporter [Muribaculaceae bacterium]MBQ5508799.1 HlyC/CorC family transporter [Muribaculaceae bacterium]
MEIAFVSSNKVRAEIDIKKGGLTSQILNIFYAHRETFISTMLVGNNIVNVIYGIGIAWLLKEPLEAWIGNDNDALVLLVQTIISTAIVLVMSEFLPKTVFRMNPNRSLRFFAVPLLLLYLLLYPISQFTSWLSMVLMRVFGIKNEKKEIRLISVGELDDYLQETIDKSEDENREVEREVKLFENALDFSDTRLRDCMIPRNEIVGVDIAETSREQLIKLFTRSGLSKLVVYHDDIDNVIGFIQVSEMFKAGVNWKDKIKPVIIAPETMLAKKMMQNLLKEKKSMAIVVDEFGGTAGMITLEDLVEEIFGDIEDEHDRRKLIARKTGENTYELSGRLEIERVNELFDLDIPESDDYQTIAGFIVTNLEVIPNQGEEHTIGNYTIHINKKTGARLELITLTVNTPHEEQED